tara:strand:- start:50 stop:484 length:435 start_codon:yes stop_codon:yes gene_type:complete
MNKLKEIIKTYIPNDVELLSLKIDSSSSYIKLTIDSIKDVSINDTAMLAKKIKSDDIIISEFPRGVKLEVGTPGIGSNLEKTFQFKKNIGREIKLKYQLNNDIIADTYVLLDANEKYIIIDDGINKNNIEYDRIISATVKVSFD